MKPLKIGLLGYGLSGRIFHGALIQALPYFEIPMIITADPEKQKQASFDFPQATIASKPQVVFDNPDIDLVVIATPNTSHYPMAMAALAAGKHVVVEKPFTVTLEEARGLINQAKSCGRLLTVYQNRRFDGDYQTVKALLESGDLGRIVGFESSFDRFRPQLKENAWREQAIPGSGLLYDLGSHLVDQALDLFGLPEAVYADIRRERGGPVDDAMEIQLFYPNHKATLKARCLVNVPIPRFAVFGVKGSYATYGLDPQENRLREGGRPPSEVSHFMVSEAALGDLSEHSVGNLSELPFGFVPQAQWGTLALASEQKILPTQAGDYLQFYRNLFLAITTGAPLAVPPEESYAVMAVIEAAMQSHLNQTVVKFSIDTL